MLIQWGHDLGAGLAHERGDGNDLVTMRTQSIDQLGECVDSGLTIAPAIVQQDDGAAHPGAGLHIVHLLEYAVDDLLRTLTGMLVPVVSIDLVADNHVAEILNAVGGGCLIVGIRLLVDGVGRAKIEWLDSKLGREQPLGEIQFQVDAGVRDFADVRMSESMIADLVPFAVYPLHQADVVLGLFADHEEGAGSRVSALECRESSASRPGPARRRS